jgi:hypothetical protein
MLQPSTPHGSVQLAGRRVTSLQHGAYIPGGGGRRKASVGGGPLGGARLPTAMPSGTEAAPGGMPGGGPAGGYRTHKPCHTPTVTGGPYDSPTSQAHPFSQTRAADFQRNPQPENGSLPGARVQRHRGPCAPVHDQALVLLQVVDPLVVAGPQGAGPQGAARWGVRLQDAPAATFWSAISAGAVFHKFLLDSPRFQPGFQHLSASSRGSLLMVGEVSVYMPCHACTVLWIVWCFGPRPPATKLCGCAPGGQRWWLWSWTL